MAKSSPTPPPKNAKSPDLPLADLEALSAILIQTAEKMQPMFQDFMSKIDWNFGDAPLDPLNIQQAYTSFFQKLYEDPDRLADMQVQYVRNWMALWQESTKKFMGHPGADLYTPDQSDRRFKSESWHDSALFDFIKQSYLMTSRWMQQVVHDTDGLDDDTRRKVEFYTRQFADAMSPTNFVLTNPDVIKATLDTKGENLIRGMQNMVDDLERGKGHLKISTTDYTAFELGRNIATTPGQVIYQNDLIQLIQYAPSTPQVYKIPLLIIPPWINKFYILDLRPDNSLIRWLVEQGHTVFVVSWVNPSPALATKTFGDYMHQGLIDALDAVQSATGEEKCNVLGYCIGGTLLATTLAWLAARGADSRIASATFLTTLIDFKDPGDIKIFIDDAQLAALDQGMKDRGLFDARNLKDTFSLLRANDLIWTFVVNNYLLGKEPFPFDLLYWNDDSTNMPAAMHSYYLRNMYKDNRLIEPGGITIDDIPVDMRNIKTPAYFLSTKDDHIAPWRATYAATQLFKGPVTFTLSGSGHVAGVINPPAANKYGYWTANTLPVSGAEWFDHAIRHDGSWWLDWQKWITSHSGEKTTPARQPQNPIEAAPGSYVKAKAG